MLVHVKCWSIDGKTITNYPKQHIEKGIEKNGRTSKRFKRIARTLKTLQVEMLDEGILPFRPLQDGAIFHLTAITTAYSLCFKLDNCPCQS